MKSIAAGRQRQVNSSVAALTSLVALAALVGRDFSGAPYVGHSNAGPNSEARDATVPVTNVLLVGRPLPAVVSEPGIYVQLYRPQGVVDFGAALPYHFTIFNNSEVAYDPWQLSFVFDGAVDHVWSAAIEEASGRYL